MKPTVYIETTIVSYLTARPSQDVLRAAHQASTLAWWDTRDAFDLVTSAFVIHEASRGDPNAAKERLEALADIPILRASPQADLLARSLLDEKAIPETVPEDAAHVSIAASAGVDFLLTWNCRHIANALLRTRIERVIRDFGFEPPIICTPDTLLGETANEE